MGWTVWLIIIIITVLFRGISVGMAERTWEASVVCAMEDRKKGSMQSVGL